MNPDIKSLIDRAPMSRFQIIAVTLCVMLNMLDGFDVLVMAFTASEVAKEWHLSSSEIGVLLSAGLFGMAGGSLFLAPWADRYGRRALILFSLSLITLGMLLSAYANGLYELVALRALTGLGIGCMLASLNVITAEYSPQKWRNTAISIQGTGYPIGATLGGMLASWLIVEFGWRSVFLFGALASALMIPLVLTALPESIDFLLARRRADALTHINRLLQRMTQPVLAELPVALDRVRGSRQAKLGRVLSGPMLVSTLLLWSTFFLLMAGFYFVLSWTPKLLVSAGLSSAQGITGGVLLNLGGISGGLLFGWLSARIKLLRLVPICLALSALMVLAFGAQAQVLSSAFAIALVIGVFIFASMVGLYALAPSLYPAEIRTTGMGWAIGIGRMGGILAPVVAGLLLDRGWAAAQLYFVFACPLLVAALTVACVGRMAPDSTL